MKPCQRCGHPYAEHATTPGHPDALRCFHGAATGDGCAVLYSDRCPNYVNPEKLALVTV